MGRTHRSYVLRLISILHTAGNYSLYAPDRQSNRALSRSLYWIWYNIVLGKVTG